MSSGRSRSSSAGAVGGVCVAHLLFLLRRALPALRRGLRARAKMAARPSCGRLASIRSTWFRWEWKLGEFAAERRDPQLRATAWARRTASRCSSTSAGSTARRSREVVADAFRRLPREPRREARSDRRGPAARRDCGARRPPHRPARLCEGPGRTGRAGWRAPTFTFRRWPTRRSACRLSKPRRPGCRSSASPPERCSTG